MPASLSSSLFTAQSKLFPVETIRVIATLLVVSYHVIGASPQSGLEQDYPSVLRIAADFLVDLRMPLFAIIAGLVFAVRPPDIRGLGRFYRNKIRRLAIPGIVAIAAFAFAARVGDSQFVLRLGDLSPLWTGYAHFWFLQSLLMIFVIYVPLDTLTKGAIAPYALVMSIAFSLSHSTIIPSMYWIGGSILLMPYFILGVVVWRHHDLVLTHRQTIAIIAALAVIIGSLWNIEILQQTSAFSNDRRDLQSLLSSMGGCMLALLVLRNFKWLHAIGTMSFAIYLYHVFGTSMMRRLLDGLGVSDLSVQLIAGTAAGLILPMAIHKLAVRHNLSRLLILGLKPLPSQQEKPKHAAIDAT